MALVSTAFNSENYIILTSIGKMGQHDKKVEGQPIFGSIGEAVSHWRGQQSWAVELGV